uniref:Uncharacterized protein n=1 Tax=Oryza sativa subsp. japonica TaxID=39947 RepID=Q7Y1N6_ORYSJ|nr:hypothetical protein [Oryza sativa Japonica Group]
MAPTDRDHGDAGYSWGMGLLPWIKSTGTLKNLKARFWTCNEVKQIFQANKAVSLFGKVIKAQLDDNVRGRLLVKAVYSSTLQVPRRIVIKRVTAFGGVGRSWTVSVFLCDGDLPDVMPTDEDLPPVNHISVPEPVPQVQPEVELFRDNMQEDAHEDQQQQSHTISALSVVAAGSHQVIQFALLAAVLLLAGHDDVEIGYGSMGPSS